MSVKILNKEVLSDFSGVRVVRMVLEAPEISRKSAAGQFIVLMVSEEGERIPLTVVESNAAAGTVTIIFQEAGLTTRLLGKLNTGGSLYALVGPLGHATEIKNYGRVILVGGGVGIAEIYPVAKALKSAGNDVTTILGARTKELLILEKELKSASSQFHIATDDGTYGRKGFVTEILKECLEGGKYDLVYAVGPIPMMQRVSEMAGKFGVKVIVSLNALMIDATGMCGCCRVVVDGKTKFSCVDGPEFEGSKVDWKGLDKRNRIYADKEKHICNLKLR
ncbi:MAG: sulfide/dihydroorotate dehydrogenase-like FAD/NAD-binding protein [Candidatus Omnitrophica bacterium]|nr:sulfide/dihydroorotate dehydrogenase-like FAD/NAD-binding protein [Candidatus Omnitrophota bacterium]